MGELEKEAELQKFLLERASNLSIFSDKHGGGKEYQVVKTSLSNAGDVGLIPRQGIRIPHPLRPKNQKHKTEVIL